jgi:hypothetical protein
MRSVLLSALEFCRSTTAQIAAGSHPMRVICKIKQTMKWRILPRRRKDTHGRSMARRSMMADLLVYTNLRKTGKNKLPLV